LENNYFLVGGVLTVDDVHGFAHPKDLPARDVAGTQRATRSSQYSGLHAIVMKKPAAAEVIVGYISQGWPGFTAAANCKNRGSRKSHSACSQSAAEAAVTPLACSAQALRTWTPGGSGWKVAIINEADRMALAIAAAFDTSQ
jgi:hypothetical protein